MVTIMILNAVRLDARPTASGPAILPVTSQNRYVKIDGINVLTEVNQIFLPIFESGIESRESYKMRYIVIGHIFGKRT